jgi:hypothetical protein
MPHWQGNCPEHSEMSESLPRQLFIVSRETPYIADYMRLQFREERDVLVLVDRRQGRDRRTTSRPVDVERRAGNRRQRPAVDQQIKEAFHALVSVS